MQRSYFSFVVLALAFGALMLGAHEAHAAGEDFVSTLVQEFYQKTHTWEPTLKKYALSIFRWLLILEVCFLGIKAALNRDQISHLFIKPVDAGLESSAVVTTNRRAYHLRLVSQRTGHTPYVGFLYSETLKQQTATKQAREAKEKEWNSTTIDGIQTDLSALNFNYEVKGKASWKPERVYDDGRQTFIRLPAKTASGEMPILLVRKGKQEVLVNYRVKDSAMVVDGLFERIALVIGVGGEQEKVEVIRGGK